MRRSLEAARFPLWTVGFALLLLPHPPRPSPEQECAIRRVSRTEILDAMRSCGTDYDIAAMTNAGRFQAEVLLELARRSRAANPEGGRLFIRQEDWFQSFLQVTGLRADEVPLGARLAHRHGQNWVVETRSERVVREVKKGPAPLAALNVRLWWSGGPWKYSYEDTLSTPHLRVSFRRVSTHRLLEFPDMIFYDEIEGLSVRPTSGALGALFLLLGDARVRESRIGVADDGLQIIRGRFTSGVLGKTVTGTVQPDGRAEKGMPAGRPDLARLEDLLRREIHIEYLPDRCQALRSTP